MNTFFGWNTIYSVNPELSHQSPFQIFVTNYSNLFNNNEISFFVVKVIGLGGYIQLTFRSDRLSKYSFLH